MLALASYPLDRYLWDRSRGRRRLNQIFFYEGEVTFAGVGDQSTSIDIDTDAPFVWLGLRSACFFPATAVDTDPFDAAIMVRYGGRGGRGFSQTPIDIRNCATPRPIPFVLPCPRPLAPGSQLFVTVSLRTAPGVLPASVQVQFFGFKSYSWQGIGGPIA